MGNKYLFHILFSLTISIELLILSLLLFGPFYPKCFINTINYFNETQIYCEILDKDNICEKWHSQTVLCSNITFTLNDLNYTVKDCQNKFNLGETSCVRNILFPKAELLTPSKIYYDLINFIIFLSFSLICFIYFVGVCGFIIIKIIKYNVKKRNEYHQIN